jgi:hypothetical protein
MRPLAQAIDCLFLWLQAPLSPLFLFPRVTPIQLMPQHPLQSIKFPGPGHYTFTVENCNECRLLTVTPVRTGAPLWSLATANIYHLQRACCVTFRSVAATAPALHLPFSGSSAPASAHPAHAVGNYSTDTAYGGSLRNGFIIV